MVTVRSPNFPFSAIAREALAGASCRARKALERFESLQVKSDPGEARGGVFMKSATAFCVVGTLLLAGLTLLSTSVAAQDSGPKHQIRYKLVDLGTFGGRASYVNPAWQLGGPQQLNLRGATVGSAATSVPSAFGCPFCNGFNGQVFNVFHAFQWSDGVLNDLGALPGELTTSIATSINAEGIAIGNSENGEIDPLTGAREIRAVFLEGRQDKKPGNLWGKSQHCWRH